MILTTIESEPGPAQETYIQAYRTARAAWLYMLTDDEACRNICDREAYLDILLKQTFPNIHENDAKWLGGLAYESVLDSFHEN